MTTLFDLPEPSTPTAPRGPARPWWVEAYETRTGGTRRLASGKAIPAPCPRCRRWCLTGYDSNVAAVQAWVDPNPLTPQLEAAAVILAIATYRLHGRPGAWTLTWRQVPGGPVVPRLSAGVVTVVADHRCDFPPLTDQHLPRPVRRAVDTDGPIPY